MEAFYKHAIASRRTLVTTNYILAELVALLTTRSRASRPRILALIDNLKHVASVRIIHIDPALDGEAWALLERHPDQNWSLVDAASFVVMRHHAHSPPTGISCKQASCDCPIVEYGQINQIPRMASLMEGAVKNGWQYEAL
ncbi:MAG TPA: hypothetical protein VN837_02590 [Chloroflexota bacterium]|nr:hypothetical protein [Chloroflexota bacterium]